MAILAPSPALAPISRATNSVLWRSNLKRIVPCSVFPNFSRHAEMLSISRRNSVPWRRECAVHGDGAPMAAGEVKVVVTREYGKNGKLIQALVRASNSGCSLYWWFFLSLFSLWVLGIWRLQCLLVFERILENIEFWAVKLSCACVLLQWVLQTLLSVVVRQRSVFVASRRISLSKLFSVLHFLQFRDHLVTICVAFPVYPARN